MMIFGNWGRAWLCDLGGGLPPFLWERMETSGHGIEYV